MKNSNYYNYESPFGNIKITTNGTAITELKLQPKPPPENNALPKNNTTPEDNAPPEPTTPPEPTASPDTISKKAAKQLDEYFKGKRKEFDLPINPQGTGFQRTVWEALKQIPYGETKTYKQIAQNINKPNACRAVGQANNKNPIWIIIPCHRVIGTGGKLTGYGGGLEMKQKLLEIEKGN